MTKQEYRAKLKYIAGLCYSLSMDLDESLDREAALESIITDLQRRNEQCKPATKFLRTPADKMARSEAAKRAWARKRADDFKEVEE